MLKNAKENLKNINKVYGLFMILSFIALIVGGLVTAPEEVDLLGSILALIFLISIGLWIVFGKPDRISNNNYYDGDYDLSEGKFSIGVLVGASIIGSLLFLVMMVLILNSIKHGSNFLSIIIGILVFSPFIFACIKCILCELSKMPRKK